jgi:hypothetical protein
MFRVTLHFPLSTLSLDTLLEAMTLINLHYLRKFPNTPTIYESGVIYEREGIGNEDWLTIPELLERGKGDCEDLATWLAAEYRFRGMFARPFASRIKTHDGRLQYHIRVRLGNGLIEDPSRKLGM